MKKDKSLERKMKLKIPVAAVLATSVLLSNFAGAVPVFASGMQITDEHGIHGELAHIEAIVSRAEQSKSMDDLIHARQDVNEMLEGQTKYDLQARLRTVEKQLLNGNPIDDAKFYVSEVELCLCTDVLSIAKGYVSELPDGSDKEALATRLKTVQYKIEHKAELSAISAATAAVERAEQMISQSDTDYARYLVNGLDANETKNSLINRLDTLQTRINASIATAESAVSKVEITKLKADYTTADTLVKALISCPSKLTLADRLAAIQYQLVDSNIGTGPGSNQGDNSNEAITQATQAVSYAESVRTVQAYNTAMALVSALQPGSKQTELENRLNKIQLISDPANETSSFQKAEEAVKAAEYMRTQENYNKAKALVDHLNEGSDKTILLQRLAVVKKHLDEQSEAHKNDEAIKSATDKVARAESSRTQGNYDIAKSFVDALPSSSDKTILLNRLQVIKDYLEEKARVEKDAASISSATVAVAKVELNRTEDNYNAAKRAVDALPDSDSKTTLLNRLETVRKSMESKNKTSSSQNSTTNTSTTTKTTESGKAISGIEKTPAQAAVEKKILTIVQKHWAKNDIQKLMDHNIFIWDNAQEFNLNDKVSQIEFTAMLVRAYEPNINVIKSDVLSGKFGSEIRVALDKGFIKGTEDLEKVMTREQAVRMMVKALNEKVTTYEPLSLDILNTYKDANKLGPLAANDFSFAIQSKLIVGDAERNLNPQAVMTKAEAISFISRLLDKLPVKK